MNRQIRICRCQIYITFEDSILFNVQKICNFRVHKQQTGEQNIPFCLSAIPLCNCLRKIAILDRKVTSTNMFIMYS